jgi:uncharacterized protein (TIGR02147 family)
MNSVYTYTDYRQMLSDYYKHRKGQNPAFSHRLFARLAGFRTSNFIHLVIRGKRNLTHASCEKLARAMKLRRRERRYFETLVAFNQARTAREKNRQLQELEKLRKGTGYRKIGKDLQTYISNWINPVVRELACMEKNPDDPKELSRRCLFRVTPGEVSRALELLQSLGLLVRNRDGTLSQATPTMSTGPGTSDAAALRYHLGSIDRAAEALQNLPPSEREIVGLTIGISEKNYAILKQKMWEFRQEVLALAESPDPEQVYQLNIQLFPVTR